VITDDELRAIQERKRADLHVPAEPPPAEPVKLPCRVCRQKAIEMPEPGRSDPVRVEAWNRMESAPPRFTCAPCRQAEEDRRLAAERQRLQEEVQMVLRARQAKFDAVRANPEAALMETDVPLRWIGARLDLCPDLPPDLIAQARQWGRNPAGMLLLYGPPGAGKSWLAVAILREVLTEGPYLPSACLYASERAFLDGLRASYGDGGGEEQRPARMLPARHPKRVPFLVFDDLGASRLTDWGRGEIAGLIEARHADDLPTIITSNIGPDGLAAAVDGRVASRIAESRQGSRTERKSDIPGCFLLQTDWSMLR
jgi:DNA replication protein DnaC